MTDRVEDGRHGVRLRMAASVDFDGDDDLLLLGFHGFGNDEHEMIRIIDALYAGTGREPNYISFRGTYDRPFIGNSYWYPDGCGVAERRRECTRVGEAVVKLLRPPCLRPLPQGTDRFLPRRVPVVSHGVGAP